jgi:hypothetical protein
MAAGDFPTIDREIFQRHIEAAAEIVVKSGTMVMIPGDLVTLRRYSSLRFPDHLSPRINWGPEIKPRSPLTEGDLGLVVKFSNDGYPLCMFGETCSWFFLHELQLSAVFSEKDLPVRLIMQCAEEYKSYLRRFAFSRRRA